MEWQLASPYVPRIPQEFSVLKIQRRAPKLNLASGLPEDPRGPKMMPDSVKDLGPKSFVRPSRKPGWAVPWSMLYQLH